MGCGASRTDFRAIWVDTIRSRLPIDNAAAQEHRRVDLFTKLDTNRSGYLTPDELVRVSSEFDLETVCDNPDAIIKVVMVTSNGAHGVGRKGFAPFLGALRDAFDLFFASLPYDNAYRKALSEENLEAICQRLQEWGHDVRLSAAMSLLRGSPPTAPFPVVLEWAMERSHKPLDGGPPIETIPQLQSVVPAHGSPAVIRDLFLLFDRHATRRLSRRDVQDGCTEELRVQRVGVAAVLAVMTAFDDSATKSSTPLGGDSDDGLELNRRGFFVFLRRLYYYCATLIVTKHQDSRGNIEIGATEIQSAERSLTRELGVVDPVGLFQAACRRQGVEHLDLVATTEALFASFLASSRLLPNLSTPWEVYSALFPLGYGENDEARRRSLFEAMGNSPTLTERELVAGCAQQFCLREIEEDITFAVRVAIGYASTPDWRSLKGAYLSDIAKRVNQTVTIDTFRMFLVTLHDYYEMLSFLAELDVSADGLISRDEFEASAELLRGCGRGGVSWEVQFEAIDRDGDGVLDLDELISWALQRRREEDEQFERRGSFREYVIQSEGGRPTVELDTEEAVAQWRMLRETFPLSRHAAADVEQRRVLFDAWDSKQNKHLTWSEVDEGARSTMQLQRIVSNPDIVVRRAFDVARTAKKRSSGLALSDASRNTIELVEFRLFLCYLYDYCEFAASYMEAVQDDPAILTKERFAKCVTILGAGANVDSETIDAMFDELDDQRRGWIPFYEFVEWAIRRGVAPSRARSGSVQRTSITAAS